MLSTYQSESIAEKIAVTVRYKGGCMVSYDRNGKMIHMQGRPPKVITHRFNPHKLEEIWKNDSRVERVIVRNGDICGIIYSAPLFDKSGDKSWDGKTGVVKVQVADKGLGRKIVFYLFLAVFACFFAPYKPRSEG